MNGSLKILYEKDADGNIISTHATRKEIIEKINKHNKTHFAMAVQTKVHDDKMHEKLDEKEARKKTLEGRLERIDCDNQ